MTISEQLTLTTIVYFGQAFVSKKIIVQTLVVRARKETADIEILITSRKKGDRKFMKPTRITSEIATVMRMWNQFSQFR